MEIPGVAKTHLSIALGIEDISHKYSTYFINSYQLMQNLLKANHKNMLNEKLKQYSKYKVLVISAVVFLRET